MKLKQIPEDFEVQERINLDNLSARSDGFAREFSYFKVERRGVEQLRALDMIARYFKVPVRHVQCSGMKDAAAIARQLVSVYDVDADSIPAALPLDPQKRVRITFVGRFKSSLRDSDHEGNRFTIVVRDLSREEAASAPEKGHAAVKTGCINYFDEQRFGYAGNSDVIGRMMLKNDLAGAVREILLSLPAKSREEQNADLLTFHQYISDHWDSIAAGPAVQSAEDARQAATLAPGFLKNEAAMLRHLASHPHDVHGAFNVIPRRLRFLYLTAFQARVFNRMVEALMSDCLSGTLPALNLCGPRARYEGRVLTEYQSALSAFGVAPEDLELKHLPEFGLDSPDRKTVIVPGNLQVSSPEPDALNKGRYSVTLSFDLARGEYATNVVKQVFAASLPG